MKAEIKNLINWIFKSGIYNSYGTHKGSFNNGYNWFLKKYPFIYHEITGYGLSMCVYLYRKLNSKKYLNYAKEIANYLLKIQEKKINSEVYGAFSQGFKYSLFGLRKIKKFYTFDNLIIANGLIDFYLTTKNSNYLDSSLRVANWIINKMRHPNIKGAFYSVYNESSKKYGNNTSKFSGDCGVLHGKIAIPFLKLWKITGQKKFYIVAKDSLDYCLTLQNRRGYFWANPKKKYVFSHAQCYITEGLLYAYFLTKKDSYRDAIEKSLLFLKKSLVHKKNFSALKHIYCDKKFSRKILFSFFPLITSDATSQYIRLVLLYNQVKKNNNFLRDYYIPECINFLVSCQIKQKNFSLIGAIPHKVFYLGKLKIMSPIISTWCSQFSLQALIEYHEPSNFIENLY